MHDKRQNSISPAGHPGLLYLRNPFLQAVLIILVGLAAYSNTFQVPFQFDDPRSITDVPFVRDLRLFPNVFMLHRSVGFFSFALNYRLHGTDVLGYHIVNLAIHILNALLVYGLVVLSFRTPKLQGSCLLKHARPIALLSALLFASHPVQTQAVTYIAQRFASLATLFFLASVAAYVESRLPARSKSSRYRSLAWYGASLLSAVLAMKTKETAFTLPIIIVLYELLFFEGPIKRRVLVLLPLMLTMVIIPISLLGIDKPLGTLMNDVSDTTKVHTTMGRSEYLFTQFRVIVTYLRLLIFPVNQNLDYDYPLFDSFLAPEVLLSFLLLMLILGTGVYLLYRDRHVPGAGRLAAFGIFWFFITLSVESSIIPIADVVFEHRLYLPSVGFFIAVTSALFWVAEKLETQWAYAARAVVVFLAAVVAVFTGLTVARNIVWQNEVSLWEDVIQKSPMKARGYNGLGLAYYNENQYDKAIEAFARAIALHPSYGVAFNNIGNAFYRRGLYGQALEAQTRAAALEPKNPVFHYNRGLTYAATGAYDRAIEEYDRAIVLDPAYAEAYNNLGLVYHVKGLYGRAIEAYTKALTFSPRNALFFNNRGLSHAADGNPDKAIEDYTQAISLDLGFADAFNGRGSVYGLQGRYGEAIADFTMALSLDPDNARYYVNRGLAHARTGQRAEALSDFQRACVMGNEMGCKGLKQLK
jgi:tetratricopeptide (TPR) repeat protein